jgi:predicted NBD/HSP70 family sugar kinase
VATDRDEEQMPDQPDVPLASLDLLRQITDRHVVDQLLNQPVLTRAELPARTGISKPTVSESVRRLTGAGLLTEADRRPSGRRGRTGVNYALRDDIGVALAVSAGPDGLVAETVDLRGTVLRRRERPVQSPVTAAQLDPLLLGLVRDAVEDAPAAVRGSALSVAGPVDRESGRLVHLPNSPFLVDELDPRQLLAGALGPALIIDNDVNWAAVAEFHQGVAGDLADFCYLYLGPGIGGAVVRNGEPVRGRAGLAGEPAHMITTGPGGRAMRLVECFAALDLLQAGSAAIDAAALTVVLAGATETDRRKREVVVNAVAGVIASMSALLNPAGVVIGGPWGSVGDVVDRISDQVAESASVPTVVRVAGLGPGAPLVGARLFAVRAARDSLFGPLATQIETRRRTLGDS